MAETAVTCVQRVFRRRFILRGCLIFFVISLSLTVLAISTGAILYGRSWQTVIASFASPLPWIILVGTNFFFDAVTSLLTYKILLLLKEKAALLQAALILVDLLIAFSLSVLRLLVGYLLVYQTFVPVTCLKRISAFLVGYDKVTPDVLFSLTMFLPTVLYLYFLLALIIAKPVLGVGRQAAMYFLDRVTEEDDPKDMVVFTLTGAVFSGVSIIVSTLIKVRDVF